MPMELTEFEEFWLDQTRVTLDLVHNGDDASGRDNGFELLDVEVGDADGSNLVGLVVDPHKLLPC